MRDTTEHAIDADVVVVGAGPVGLMLACELSLHGVGVMILERAEVVDQRVRAPGLSRRTVEALDRRGLLDPLIAELNKAGARYSTARAHGGRAPEEVPLSPGLLENVLAARLTSLGGVLCRGHEVTEFGAAGEKVITSVRTTDGNQHRIRSSYLVGCDGGRSTVRKNAGIGFPGADVGIVGYQAVVTVDAPERLSVGWHRTRGGISAYLPSAERLVSVEWDRPRPSHPCPVTLSEVQDSVRRTSGADVTLSEPRSLTRFTGSCRLAERYREGRVLLAGDAAHVHPPFGGQGLNLGMQDAVNLGWKLAAVVRGWAPPALLDTYEQERRPLGERVVRNARAFVQVLRPDEWNTPVYELFFTELQTDQRVRRRIREMCAMTDVRYPFGNDHADLPLAPGTAMPNLVWRDDGAPRCLAGVQHAGRTVLVDLADRRDLRGVAAAWADRVDVVTAPVEDPMGCEAVLVRPDGYIAWVCPSDGDPAPKGLADALRTWCGEPATFEAGTHRIKAR